MGTLRQFTALKELDTHVDVLIHSPGNLAAEYDELVHLLPASLEKLSLDTRTGSCYGSIPYLIEQFVRKGKPEFLPKLKSLKLLVEPFVIMQGKVKSGSITPKKKNLKEVMCHEVGIELIIVET